MSSTIENISSESLSVTDELMREHQLILKIIGWMEPILNQPSLVTPAQFFEIGSLFVRFIREFADTFHHAKEEDILFQALNQPGVLTHCNPVGQMLYEHDLGRQAVSAMADALEKQNIQSFVTAAKDWSQLLQQHIFKEDNILYPMAEQSLGESIRSQLLEAYKKAGEQHQGKKLWTEFETFAEQLAALNQ